MIGSRGGAAAGLQGVSLHTVLKLARMAALGGALALAGCVTVENALSPNDVADMKLTAVTVNVDPGALII